MSNVIDQVSDKVRSVRSEKESNNLLSQFVNNEDVYFSTTQYALLVKPPFAAMGSTKHSTLSKSVHDGLDFLKKIGVEDCILVGAVSFDVEHESQLFVSRNFSFDHNHTRTYVNDNSRAPLIAKSIVEIPSKAEFKKGVENALSRFERNELQKMVLSRTLNIKFDQDIQIKKTIETLEQTNQSGFVFGVKMFSEHLQHNQTLIGASPELLLSKRGNKISAMPLAGSEPRGKTDSEETILSQRLLTSEKDLREHALVVESIKQVLTPFCKYLNIPDSPSLINTPTMWHLASSIEGELNNADVSSLDVALAMHPTPAVCGFPKAVARQAISEIESHERGLFTGMVGWNDANGDGDWVVTIRCATVEGKNATLYAGAGIVAGSSAEKEYQETGAKFNTMLNAFGLKGRLNEK
ncbi:isochorismate synthase [Marinicellulosiphila megalodicopiae]|uniref:isochorismate synthase n=1 Tax=Marinicellulosiphila megalodicopiae TaxID=2724896 RepID=UPI003BB0C635